MSRTKKRPDVVCKRLLKKNNGSELKTMSDMRQHSSSYSEQQIDRSLNKVAGRPMPKR